MTDTATPARKQGLTRFPLIATLIFALVYGGAMVLLFAPKDLLGTVPASLMTVGD